MKNFKQGDKVKYREGNTIYTVVLESLWNFIVIKSDKSWDTFHVEEEKLILVDNINKTMEAQKPIDKLSQIEINDFFSDKKNIKKLKDAREQLSTKLQNLEASKDRLCIVIRKTNTILDNLNIAINQNDLSHLELILNSIDDVIEFVDRFSENRICDFNPEKPAKKIDIQSYFGNK